MPLWGNDRIRQLEREIRRLNVDLDDRTMELNRTRKLVDLGLRVITDEQKTAALGAAERHKEVMAGLKRLSDLAHAESETIRAEDAEVKAKLDELQQLIVQLRDNANDPAEVEAIADEMSKNRQAVADIFIGDAAPAKRGQWFAPPPGTGT